MTAAQLRAAGLLSPQTLTEAELSQALEAARFDTAPDCRRAWLRDEARRRDLARKNTKQEPHHADQ